MIVMGLVTLGCLFGAFWNYRRKRLIDDLPTSKTLGVFIGLTELKGTAENETPFTSFFAGVRCVHYSWHIDEHWSRMVTETYRDAQGHTQTRTRHESGWTKVAGGGESAPFYLKDDTGVIRIAPEGATINGVETFDETRSRNDPLYFGKGPAREIANSDHRRRFQETAIPLHAQLYVMGQARERGDVVAAEIAKDKESPMFLISTRTEKLVSSGYRFWYWFWLILGLLAAVSAAGIWNSLYGFGFAGRWQPYAVALPGFLTVLLLGWVWTVYNSIAHLYQRVRQAWSQVDIQLKRRNDLIPSLVKAIEGYRSHETETQKIVAELRGQLVSESERPGVENLRGFTTSLRIIIENYPDLKANESFLRLQETLIDTEERIAMARDYFNEIATFYNTRLEIIPDRFVATLLGLKLQSLMCAADFERAPVDVRLVS